MVSKSASLRGFFSFSLLLSSTSSFSCESVLSGRSELYSPISSSSLFVPKSLGNLSLFHNDTNGFMVRDNDLKSPSLSLVKPYRLDKELRGISDVTLKRYIAHGAYLSLNRCGHDEYTLQLQGRVKGGGPFGAMLGAVAGKFLVHAAAQVTYLGVSGVVGIFCPPAAPAVYCALQATFAAPVEAASNVGAVALGITGGVLTGPA